MTDGQWLLAIFAGFYLIECLHWLPLGCAVFKASARARRWSVSGPSAQLAAQNCGLAVAWPLPLLGNFLVAQPWLILPDEEGLSLSDGHPRTGERVSWSDVKPVVDQSNVVIAHGLRVRCATPRAARSLRDFLVEAKAAKLNPRRTLISEWWQNSLSLPRAKAAARRYRIAASVLRWPCVLGFLVCFIYLPWLFWFFSGGVRVLAGFASLLLLNTLIAFTWRALDRRLHPKCQAARWGQVLHLIFMPAHTLRALDLLGADALLGIHPLAAAGVMLSETDRQTFASQLWRRWNYAGTKDSARKIVPQVLPKLEANIKQQGLALSTLDAPPERPSNAASYCPQCHTQFDQPKATCESCAGVETREW